MWRVYDVYVTFVNASKLSRNIIRRIITPSLLFETGINCTFSDLLFRADLGLRGNSEIVIEKGHFASVGFCIYQGNASKNCFGFCNLFRGHSEIFPRHKNDILFPRKMAPNICRDFIHKNYKNTINCDVCSWRSIFSLCLKIYSPWVLSSELHFQNAITRCCTL